MGSQTGESLSKAFRARSVRFRRERTRTGDRTWELALVRGTSPAPRFAGGIVTSVFAGFFFIQTVNILQVTERKSPRVLALTVLLAIAVLQFSHSAPRARAFRARYGSWTLTAQALLPLVPAVATGVHWAGMGGFAAGSALLVLPGPAAWACFAAVVAAVGGSAAVHASSPVSFHVLYLVLATCLTGMVVYSLTRLAELVTAIRSARGELARMAVARERLRFSRDLHDLLGYSLSSITLKSELAHRLIRCDPEQAECEVMGVLDISRQALSDIREVARSYRDMSLTAEAGSARALLEAAGIETRVRIACGELSCPANTVLATVLREGVANLLRHSQVRSCSIEAVKRNGYVRLDVVNDGVLDRSPQGGPQPEGRGGTGLDSLTARVTALGGRLSARRGEGGTFRLMAEVPVAAKEEDPAVA